MNDPIAVGRFFGATFRTWARVLPLGVLTMAIAGAPTIVWLTGHRFGWTAIGFGLGGEAIAWSVVTPRWIAAARGLRGGSMVDGVRAVPRVIAGLAVAYAPFIVPILVIQFGPDFDVSGGDELAMLIALLLPIGASILALALYARWIVVVPIATLQRALGLRESAELTKPHRSALEGVVILVSLIGFAAIGTGALVFHGVHARGALLGSAVGWFATSTVRGAMSAAAYVAIVDRWGSADLARVFD